MKLTDTRLKDLTDFSDLLEEDFNDEFTNLLRHKFETIKVLLPYIIQSLQKSQNEDLETCLEKEWYQSWPELEWFKTSWITSMTQSLSKVPGDLCEKHHSLLELFISMFNDLIKYLGKRFIRDFVMIRFEQFFPPPPLENLQKFSDQELRTYQSCIVPVYAEGLLSKIEAPEDIADKLQELAISYCTNPDLDPWPISKAIELVIDINDDPGYRDSIAELGWTLLVHPGSKVKILASLTLQHLALKQSQGDLIGHKILPGLVTLSSDPDPNVRSSAFLGLSNVIISSNSSMETREKAAFQLVSFISLEHETNLEVNLSAIVAIGSIMGKDSCPHKLRDDLFLPKILEFINAIK